MPMSDAERQARRRQRIAEGKTVAWADVHEIDIGVLHRARLLKNPFETDKTVIGAAVMELLRASSFYDGFRTT